MNSLITGASKELLALLPAVLPLVVMVLVVQVLPKYRLGLLFFIAGWIAFGLLVWSVYEGGVSR